MIINMVEAAGFEVTEIIDESVAVARVLNIRDGAVVDVGGGTTGISILRKGDVIFSADEPTGGNHMTLVLCGAMDISFADAEEMQRAPEHRTGLRHSAPGGGKWPIWRLDGWRIIRRM